jgi:tetratricopeptide (TPR) repeat protein
VPSVFCLSHPFLWLPAIIDHKIMILTQCASCAAPLERLAKQCSRCKTRYCGPACQRQHWEAGGHDKLCKDIRKCGGAEQYHAEKRYKESVEVAAEACADDTKGQTCYICTQALHWKTKEGLVRGCACRGTAGFAHVSCLAEQAKILWAEVEENNLDNKAKDARWRRWFKCSLCEQDYHGVVDCALGWACWKTYVGWPETDPARRMAMTKLGNGLTQVGHHKEALSVQEAELSTLRYVGDCEHNILSVQGNLAGTYSKLGRRAEALSMERDVYYGRLQLHGEEYIWSLAAASNYATSLRDLGRFEEAKSLLRQTIPVARRVLGAEHRNALRLGWNYAAALCNDPASTLDELREATTTLEETVRTARRVLGGAHPLTVDIERGLQTSREKIRARETSVGSTDVSAAQEALEAIDIWKLMEAMKAA